jgi:hypothetical protein
MIIMAMQIILLLKKLKTDCFETLVILPAFIPLISAFVKQKLSRIWDSQGSVGLTNPAKVLAGLTKIRVNPLNTNYTLSWYIRADKRQRQQDPVYQ